jgi:hypothetical protein
MNMSTQMLETPTISTMQEILRGISALPNESIPKLADYVKWLAEEAEIAALEAKYGTTPNAETIAAIEECRKGGGIPMTLEEIRAECEALRPMSKR